MKLKIVVPLLFIAYMLFFPRLLPEEWSLKPDWGMNVQHARAAAAPDTDVAGYIPFRLGTTMGYVTESGDLVLKEAVAYDVTYSDDLFINYANIQDALIVRKPEGQIFSIVRIPGYPFFMENRLFVLHPQGTALSEVDIEGTVLWEREFGSLITALSVQGDRVVVGVLNNRLEIIDREGKLVSNFTPPGGRIEAIYGVGSSSDERYLAVVSGLEPQRLSILEKNEDALIRTRIAELEQPVRETIAVHYSPDSRFLFLQQSGGFRIYDERLKLLQDNNRGDIRFIFPESITGLSVVCQNTGDSSMISYLHPEFGTIISLPLSGSSVFTSRKREQLILGFGTSLGALREVFR